MSSHREAPETSKDPVADNTDVYAFVSPDAPDTVTLIANYLPFQAPDGGPNFYEFGEDVLYEIHVSNTAKAEEDVTYQFRFTTKVRNKNTFLYNTGPIDSLDSENWNRPQYYSVTRVAGGKKRVLANDVPCPPVNVGVRSTPNYSDLADAATRTIAGGRKVFAGQRADAFHVDLGSIFDLGALRPFQSLHAFAPKTDQPGVNTLQSFNVHTIAIQVPITDLTKNGTRPDDPSKRNASIGVYASASRRKNRMYDEKSGTYVGTGPFKQVSRLGNPLFNEVIVPMAKKDKWNSTAPNADAAFAKYVNRPELAALLPVLYPGVFPNLADYDKDRADLAAILLTGIPAGVVAPDFSTFTGGTPADLLRLNLAIPPTTPGDENVYGVLGNDVAGFPNGRRPLDDVVAIELRAVAGATIPLVDPDYTADDASGALKDGTENTNSELLDVFPYLGLPGGGYQTVPGTTSVD